MASAVEYGDNKMNKEANVIEALIERVEALEKRLAQEETTAEDAYQELDKRLTDLEYHFGRVEQAVDNHTNELYGMRYGRYDDELI